MATPDQKENAKTRVRNPHTLRLGSEKRIPLSPSRAKHAVDDLAADLDGLSVSPTKPKRPLAAPPGTSARLKSLNPTSSSSSTSLSSSTYKTLAQTDTSRPGRTYKPIDDYRSPIQLLTRDPDWEALAPQAQHGMLGLHGDMPLNLTGVVKNDWHGHTAIVSETTKAQARELSSRNTTVELPKPSWVENDEDAKLRTQDGIDDRFLGQRTVDGGFHAGHTLAAPEIEPTDDVEHAARLRNALDIEAPSERILSFAAAAPRPREDPTFALQRELVKPLYARPGAVGGSNGVYTNKTRRIPTAAERILDAPGLINDYYLNLLAWSCTNLVGVALGDTTYTWNAETNATELLSTCDQPENGNSYIASLDFSNDGSYAGVGLDSGTVEIWDIETRTRLRSMTGHQAQVSVLSWNNHIVSSGCADGSIWHHDVRIGAHKVMELNGHVGEVCGLKWRSDGDALASGGNDNVVNCWDPRVGAVGGDARGTAKWSKSTHTAAVKAIAWSSWNPNLLASGGGTNDCRINIWSTSTGARLHSIPTPAQVTSIQFSPFTKEIFSTHGFPTNALMIHAYPGCERVAEIRDAHEARVLNSAVSPAGDLVVTNSGDENIKFWRIWEREAPAKKSGKERKENVRSTDRTIR